MDSMPAAWAKYAEEKGAAPDKEADNKWPRSLLQDEHGIRLTITLLGRNIANAANGGTVQRKYQVLVFPDRLRELNTRRHKYLDNSFRREHGIPDPRVQMAMNFRTGEVCRVFLDLSPWSRLLMEDEALERIDDGKGEPPDIIAISRRTALIGRQLDERDPELMTTLRREYHTEREFLLPDQEYLRRLKTELLFLAGTVTEEQGGRG